MAGPRLQRSHHPRAPQPPVHVATPALQALGDQITGGVLFIGKLGVGMDLVPDGNHFSLMGSNFGERGWEQLRVHDQTP